MEDKKKYKIEEIKQGCAYYDNETKANCIVGEKICDVLLITYYDYMVKSFVSIYIRYTDGRFSDVKNYF